LAGKVVGVADSETTAGDVADSTPVDTSAQDARAGTKASATATKKIARNVVD
jgi:hypothetical protein